ncbi:CheR family methyltransferase [Neptunicella sp. SCSIO 80796]|uniref:CheR family methyltransferase n=1 Tax=Neptunicella plasticusilytica TaxID=3117012 RepID=UPI003A4D885C
MSSNDFDASNYLEFCNYLERQCGIVLGANKQYLVRSRLAPLVARFSLENLASLLTKFTRGMDRQLNAAVVDAMTTNETLWFRDTYPFEILKNKLLDNFTGKRVPIRIWSAACSSGQEPYSIAMTIHEYMQNKPGAFPGGIQIIGTDISSDMLERCKKAEYNNLSLGRGLSAERRTKFFEDVGNGDMRVIKPVRDMVSFKPINLLESYTSLGKFDLVFCRNVLIYFSAEIKTRILQQIAAGLQPGGILMVGASESMSGLSDKYTLHRCSPGMYYSKKQ